jgi:hypothetical protein
MLRSEAIAIIKRGLGFRPTQDTAIIAALKEAQRTLELGHTLPNFLLAYDAAVAVTNGSPTITLPTGFIRFHDDYQLYYVNSSGARVFLPRKNYTEAYQAYVASGDENGQVTVTTYTYPQVLVQRGKSSAILIPTPAIGFTAYLTYYKAAALLDTDIENEWLANAPDVLIGMAGMTVAGNVRDKDALAEFTRRANMGGKSLMGDIVEDELAGRPLVMGRNN